MNKKLKSAGAIALGGFAAFASINFVRYNESFYRNYVMPIIHLTDAEFAHKLAVFVGKHRVMPKNPYKDPESLSVELFGHKLKNPIGIAAGFDKQGEAVQGLFDWGFSIVEIGSVTPCAQDGNAKPRVFRLKEDLAVVNRYGFNSEGHDIVCNRLIELDPSSKTGLLGVNLGKNKLSEDAVQDYTSGIKKFADVADYIVINVSSPNTPGLRSLQHEKQLNNLLEVIIATRDALGAKKLPIVLKLSPDLSSDELKSIGKVVAKWHLDGLIISNTSTKRPEGLKSMWRDEDGGMSGVPLKDNSTRIIAEMYSLTNGQIPIIGVGGISNGKDAYEKIRAGASVLQIYTCLIYDGPPVVNKIKRELAELLKRDGFDNVSDAVGVDLKRK